MKKNIFTVILMFMFTVSMMFSITGCESENDLTPNSANITDFAIRLFKESEEPGKNTLISPLSVLCALAMTANGAENNTLEQMQRVLGMSIDELNNYIRSYMSALPQDEKNKLSIANSVWFKNSDSFTVNQDFLQLANDYYRADIYEAHFNESTLSDINDWVNSKTNGMIPEILDNISEDAVMFLINALAFEAEWENMYSERKVSEGNFTLKDGTIQKVEFMYSEEESYIEDSRAKGFIKYYRGRKYAFVALLPNKNITVSEYIESLDGVSLNKLISKPKDFTVRTAIPKFETEYSVEMSEILSSMGMTDAFDGNLADFTELGTSTEGNLYINFVKHKTFISVGEKGTKAGAATAVGVYENGASPDEKEFKTVYLDRPFVYMLIDCETCIPFFIGTMMKVNE